jgi:hypothetical protein
MHFSMTPKAGHELGASDRHPALPQAVPGTARSCQVILAFPGAGLPSYRLAQPVLPGTEQLEQHDAKQNTLRGLPGTFTFSQLVARWLDYTCLEAPSPQDNKRVSQKDMQPRRTGTPLMCW